MATGNDLLHGLTPEEISKIKQTKRAFFQKNGQQEEKNPGKTNLTNKDVLSFADNLPPKLLVYAVKLSSKSDIGNRNETNCIQANECIPGLVMALPGEADMSKAFMKVQFQSNRIDQILSSENENEEEMNG